MMAEISAAATTLIGLVISGGLAIAAQVVVKRRSPADTAQVFSTVWADMTKGLQTELARLRERLDATEQAERTCKAALVALENDIVALRRLIQQGDQ